MTTRLGYKASAEQFGPGELLGFSVLAEELGFESIAVSDHFQPWRHRSGHAPAALPWLGALTHATTTARLGTSVLTPTFRYHPSVVAQAFATLTLLSGDRLFLGVGTGEALNEVPATAMEWPGAKERRRRLAEAIELMRRLWTEERVDFDGEHYRTSRATIYDRPERPVPVHVAASGPLAAKLAGRVGDGFITTSGKDPKLYEELLAKVEEGARDAGRDPESIERTLEVKVSYDTDRDEAVRACHWWAPLALPAEVKSGVDDPLEMERLADENLDLAAGRFVVSDDPDEVVERIRPYIDLGFDHLLFHLPAHDQRRSLELLASDVLPRLREVTA